MLAIFHKSLAHPPQELNSPDGGQTGPKKPEEILGEFDSLHTDSSFCATFSVGAALALACVPSHSHYSPKQRLFCSLDDIYCMFFGGLDNLCSLIRQYGLGKNTNEALLVIEAYRTLRDRGPYPAHQVLKDLGGSFAFVLYDYKAGTIFAALSGDGKIPLYWGIAADGSVVICDDVGIIKGGCGKSYAPFPAGCMFHSEGGLKSFEYPMNRLRPMPRVDSEGVMCGANFNVDIHSRINSMPRVGSSTNWTFWDQSVL